MTAESMKSIQQLKELTKDGKVTNKRFIRTKEGVELYQMGKTKFLQMARDSGALYKIDGVCLIEVEIFEAYMDTFRVPGEIK